jgi:hypothetical protein
MIEAASALQRVLRKEFDRLLDDPEQLEKMLTMLYQIAQRKALEDHNLDLCTVTGLLFKHTKNQPDSEDHQFALMMLRKYDIPNPREFANRMHPPGRSRGPFGLVRNKCSQKDQCESEC